MSKPGTDYRADIDGLRALAVSVVVLFHLDISWLPGGFVGVDVFFVISGFLITSLILRRIEAGSFSLVDFYERRFRRIYPNLLIVLAATTVLGWFALMPEPYRFFGRTLVWAALSASNFAFMGGGGYFDPGNLTKPLLHTWSLGVEEQFYLIFPWLLMLAAKRRYRTAWLVGGAVVLSLALSIVTGMAGWSPSYFLLPTRFWELGTGALIAILPLSEHLTPVRRGALGIAGLAAIIWASLFLRESASFPGYAALAPVLGAAAVIVANGGPVNRMIALAPFAWIGRLSYALYLWHWPLISLGAGLGLSPKDTTTRVAVIALSFILSIVGYHLWEIPIRRRQRLKSRRTLFVALTISVALFAAGGVAIYNAKGFPHRLPKEVSEIYERTKANSRLVVKNCPKDEGQGYSCPVGSPEASSVSFFIIGDSHSEAAAAEIGDIAAQYGLRGLFFGKSACKLFAEPVQKSTVECVAQNELAMKTFGELKPGLVIAITRWPDFLSDDSADKDLPTRYHSMQEVLDKSLSFYGTSAFVTALAIPTYQTNIAEFTGRNWFRNRMGLIAPPDPTMSIAEYRERQASVQGLLDGMRLKHTNLSVVDPASALCPNDTCISMLDGKPLYYDTNHLSHLGAVLYAALFRPYFEELAQKLARAKSDDKGATANNPN